MKIPELPNLFDMIARRWYVEPRVMTDERPVLDLAVNGEGVTPADVSLRDLANMASAAASLLEAIVAGSALQTVRVALTEIKSGSAKYAIHASSPDGDDAFSAAVERAHELVKTRGREASEDERHALRRLFKSCPVGPISIGGRSVSYGRPKTLKALTMAAPIELVPTNFSSGTVIYGRIVGLEAQHGGKRMLIRVSPPSGPRIDMHADQRVAEHAGRLFNKTARVKCSATWDDQWNASEWEATDVSAWFDSDFADVIGEVAAELRASGLSESPSDILRAIRDE